MNTKTILSLYNGEYTCVEKLIEHHNLLVIVELEETFIEVFSLAVSLLLEAISEK